MPDRSRIKPRVGVGEDDDVGRRPGNEIVQDGRFAALFGEFHDASSLPEDRASQVRGLIAAAVTPDGNAKRKDRLLREQVLHARLDDIFLVRRGENDLERKPRRGASDSPSRAPREARDQGRIPQIRPGRHQDRERRECHRERAHFSDALRTSSRAKPRPISRQS